ncbi:MAG: toll/interleukin-1 receptor domain-containing protein [Chloroflexi bacterium]|nr:toll/interleukin-1 receptor domain-containing protein [Chloroflexota bacterium]
MDNPLDTPRTPENFLHDVEDLARDLAYGATLGEWDASVAVGHFAVNNYGFWWAEDMMEKSALQEKFFQKWIGPRDGRLVSPGYDILEAFGYMTRVVAAGKLSSDEHDKLLYSLTRRAFDLLQKPAQAPHIFVSYRRRESSAFALLVEARLRLAGADPDRIFIDKTIPGGVLWEQHIHSHAVACDALIVLIGPATLDEGSWVIREIEIVKAENARAQIIPVCHNGVTIADPRVQSLLGPYNGTHVQEEKALEYEQAISFVLNALGYKTY